MEIISSDLKLQNLAAQAVDQGIYRLVTVTAVLLNENDDAAVNWRLIVTLPPGCSIQSATLTLPGSLVLGGVPGPSLSDPNLGMVEGYVTFTSATPLGVTATASLALTLRQNKQVAKRGTIGMFAYGERPDPNGSTNAASIAIPAP